MRQVRRACAVLCAVALLGIAAAAAQERPLNAVLLDKLCARTLRANEEDRFLGTISIAVRTTIKYEGGVFSPDLIDDAVQEATEAIAAACPKIAATDDPRRLGMIVDIAGDVTRRLLREPGQKYEAGQLDSATAADLSEELSSNEIDAWLDSLPPRQRAVALFLYASDVGEAEIAAAVGVPRSVLAQASAATKANLMTFFRQEPPPPPPDRSAGPSMAYRIVAAAGPAAGEPGRAAPETAPEGRPEPGEPAAMRIVGISADLYSGWSMMAFATGLPPGRGFDIKEPVVLEPDTPGRKRMIAVAAQEVSDPGDRYRRFLVKAYAIDPDAEGSGYRETFHLGRPVDNPEVLRTLRNTGLSAIETARCLWRDYGAADPGLCR